MLARFTFLGSRASGRAVTAPIDLSALSYIMRVPFLFTEDQVTASHVTLLMNLLSLLLLVSGLGKC